jgi:hypothetical protein
LSCVKAAQCHNNTGCDASIMNDDFAAIGSVQLALAPDSQP